MNDDLQRRLTKLEEMMGVQKDCISPDDPLSCNYMHGMLNGMIYSHSLITGMQPDYHAMPKKLRRTKIRHKGRK